MISASAQPKTQKKRKLNQDSGGPPPARDEEQVWVFYQFPPPNAHSPLPLRLPHSLAIPTPFPLRPPSAPYSQLPMPLITLFLTRS